ncbi:MAG TPA: helicase-exonuclease AddAB subunit AddB [Clostridia bacterium]|nr:helicase-exonuclease AddAB subunit AddB [Clostridia bacterium]
MGLRIVYGRAGSGKSAFCLHEIKNRVGAEHPLILIVPEQFSLQAEKSLARTTGSSGIFSAEVLSFRRLAFRVFSEVGGISLKHLDASGKSMLLFRILDSLSGDLKVFSRAALRKGFTETLSDAITEFKRYDVPPEQLHLAAGKLDGSLPLKDKLSDLALVYSEFENQLHRNYLDADDDLTELYKKLDESRQFDGAEIWIDEFSGFTPQEYKIIAKLLGKVERVTVCLCTDSISDGAGSLSGGQGGGSMVFEPVRNTAVKLVRLAEKDGITVEKPVKLDGRNGTLPRFATSEELGHLERNFYSFPYKKYAKQCEDVCISASANPYSEVEDCARDIVRLCREHSFRYRDIAVTMRNPESYTGIVKSIFARYGVPFFLDGNRSIDGHPLIVFINSALEILTSSWSYEAVFRYARTGLAGVGRDELDLLENYVLANGIRGNAWTRSEDWDRPVTMTEAGAEPGQREEEYLLRVNAARRLLAEPLEALRSKTKGGTSAVSFCTALYELLCETGADKRMDELSKQIAAEGLLDRADEYRQVWNIVMDVFSQVVEVLGDEKLGAERFSEVLAAGFEGHKMGLIPPALDQVLVGSIERARSHEIKALYILGANEGVLPGTKTDQGLLSDMDRDNLGQMGLELAGNTTKRCLEERFMVYMALATPSVYLWLSYPTADRDGKALRPSRVISEVRRILPGVIIKSTVTSADQGEMTIPAAQEPAFDELVVQLRRYYDGEPVNEGWRDIYRWFTNNEGWKDKCSKILDGLGYTNQANRLTGSRASGLYGNPVFTSISRMEAYASCPFSYYIKYGLKAKERRIYSFDPVDAGTFMHHIIDEFSRLLVKKGVSWRQLDEKWCAEQVTSLVGKWLSVNAGSILVSSKKYLYFSEKLRRTVTKALMHISRHISSGGFEPSGYEVEFGDRGRYPAISIELPTGECIKMTGRIDRVDSLNSEDGTYLRIIDYKSGNRALKLVDVYYGLQLQLITYLDAVLESEEAAGGKGRSPAAAFGQVSDGCGLGQSEGEGAGGHGSDGKGKPLPAGVLYFRLDDPMIRCGRESTDEEIEKAIMKELRMKGLVLADVKLLKEMDKQIDGDSLIIPARINKDGTLGRSSAATGDQFDALRKYVRKTLASIGSGILEGNVAISPYKKKALTACTYCSFSSVCQFDTSVRDNRYRMLADRKDEDWWRLMKDAGSEAESEAAAVNTAAEKPVGK